MHKHKRQQIFFDDPVLTEQSHIDSCDINKIMERYKKTGQVPVYANAVPSAGDFSEVYDFYSAECLVANAKSMFEDLPADIRQAFNHDPGEFVAAVDDPTQRAKLIKLGVIIDKEPPKEGVVKEPLNEAPKAPEGGVKA